MRGTIASFHNFPSRFVASRRIDVWLPPAAQRAGGWRLPVVYAHDGQNLFFPTHSFLGIDWGLDEALACLAAAGKAAMAVGIWNTPARLQEYLPRKPLFIGPTSDPGAEAQYGQEILSDAYLRFLTEELKPFVDASYPTLTDLRHTFLMGSSMGALISLYGLCEYPEVFGGAACLSTHWPALGEKMLAYLAAALPPPGRHRIYFDHGTETLDAAYGAWQVRVDRLMCQAGYREGRDWITRVFPGAEHSERAWRARVHIPLTFLLSELEDCRAAEVANLESLRSGAGGRL